MASLALMASTRHVPKVGLANARTIGGHDDEPLYPLFISSVSEFLL